MDSTGLRLKNMEPPPDRSVWNSAMPMQNVMCCAREDYNFPSAGLTRVTADEMRQQKHEAWLQVKTDSWKRPRA
jgi:hypothetical protein